MTDKKLAAAILLIGCPIILLLKLASIHCDISHEVPQAPIVINSTRRNYAVNSDPDYLYWGAAYSSSQSYEEIVSFYRGKKASCYAITDGTACSGEAEPFGTYMAYIKTTPNLLTRATEFTILVEWDSCR